MGRLLGMQISLYQKQVSFIFFLFIYMFLVRRTCAPLRFLCVVGLVLRMFFWFLEFKLILIISFGYAWFFIMKVRILMLFWILLWMDLRGLLWLQVVLFDFCDSLICMYVKWWTLIWVAIRMLLFFFNFILILIEDSIFSAIAGNLNRVPHS